MGKDKIVEALGLIAILKGMRLFLNEINIEKLITIGLEHISSNNPNYIFQTKQNRFEAFLKEDFKIMIQYTKEDYDEEYYFKERKTLKELNTEYRLFYKFLSKEIINEKSKYIRVLVKGEDENLSFILFQTKEEYKQFSNSKDFQKVHSDIRENLSEMFNTFSKQHKKIKLL